jgi:branched-chain amino acid aminotransferase
VAANIDFVPPQGKGSLYLRPLLVGSGPILGLGPAPSYTLVVYCAAVGTYFKGSQLTPIDLIVETRFHRAAPGGMGGTKCAGNYSPVLVTQVRGGAGGLSVPLPSCAKTEQCRLGMGLDTKANDAARKAGLATKFKDAA